MFCTNVDKPIRNSFFALHFLPDHARHCVYSCGQQSLHRSESRYRAFLGTEGHVGRGPSWVYMLSGMLGAKWRLMPCRADVSHVSQEARE